MAYPQGRPGPFFEAGRLRSDRCGCGGWRSRPAAAAPAVYTAWMSQPCRPSSMNGTFTSYSAVRMMPAGQVAQQWTIRRTRLATFAIEVSSSARCTGRCHERVFQARQAEPGPPESGSHTGIPVPLMSRGHQGLPRVHDGHPGPPPWTCSAPARAAGWHRCLNKPPAAGKRGFPFPILAPLTCKETRMTTTRGRADWRAAGACAQADPDLFFPISSTGRALGQFAKAKAICAACPVRRPCLEFALENDLVYGIWGGTTPAERQARRREQRPGSLGDSPGRLRATPTGVSSPQ
jgi:WhiB family transcriptional regulator, redox-sensing transcriptional regulator